MQAPQVIFTTASTKVIVVDSPDPRAGGACHRYEVIDYEGNTLAALQFQHGPIGEVGVNGVQHVDLLAIIQHRIDMFQAGPFASAVNEVTGGFVGSAISSEGTRTRRRVAAGVEGLSKKAPGVEG